MRIGTTIQLLHTKAIVQIIYFGQDTFTALIIQPGGLTNVQVGDSITIDTTVLRRVGLVWRQISQG